MPPGVPGAKAWVRRCGPARTRAGDAGARGCGSSRHAIRWHTRAYCVPPVLCARRARDLVARPVVKRGPHTGEGAPTQRDVSAYAVCGCSGGGGGDGESWCAVATQARNPTWWSSQPGRWAAGALRVLGGHAALQSRRVPPTRGSPGVVPPTQGTWCASRDPAASLWVQRVA